MTAIHITGTRPLVSTSDQTGIMELKGIYCSVLLVLCLLSAMSSAQMGFGMGFGMGMMDPKYLRRLPPCQRLSFCFYKPPIMGMIQKFTKFDLHSVTSDVESLCASLNGGCDSHKDACQNHGVLDPVQGSEDLIKMLCENKARLMEGKMLWKKAGSMMNHCFGYNSLTENKMKYRKCKDKLFAVPDNLFPLDKKHLFFDLMDIFAERAAQDM